MFVTIPRSDRMEKSDRTVYFDYLRVFASIAVVILHVSAQKWYSVDVNGFQWQVFNIFDSAVRWSVPVFVMISGSLFLGKEVPLKTIYSKYILHLATSFVIWSAIYACFTNGSLGQKLLIFVMGHHHMWFLFMIIGLYMCIPIIKPIARDKNRSGYFLVIALVFAFVIPETLMLANDFGGTRIVKLANALKEVLSDMHMDIVLGYASYFVLGHYLHRIVLSKKQRSIIYLLGAAGFITTAVLTSGVSLKTQQAYANYYEYFTVNVLLEATAVFVWFKYRQYHPGKHYKVIQNLSKYSFGVYLVHVLILEQLCARLGLNTLSFNPILFVICLSIFISVSSFAFSAILNSIPIVKKFMV